MKTPQNLNLIGFASGIAANNPDCALGPWYLYYHPSLFASLSFKTHWHAMVQTTSLAYGHAVLPLAEQNLSELAQVVLPLAENNQAFCVVGGDHSSAIGTWSAVAHANRVRGAIGLIWIDAHMDSHTPETSETQNIHGMPVAHLMGHGVASLCQLLDKAPKVMPEHICLIGIRSYQAGEAALLAQLGVKIYFIEEIRARGIEAIFKEAQEYVLQNTCGFGLSIDLDGFDPLDAPGVGCREVGGIDGQAFLKAVQANLNKAQFLGLEITEYNPIRDINAKSAQLLVEIINAVYG